MVTGNKLENISLVLLTYLMEMKLVILVGLYLLGMPQLSSSCSDSSEGEYSNESGVLKSLDFDCYTFLVTVDI